MHEMPRKTRQSRPDYSLLVSPSGQTPSEAAYKVAMRDSESAAMPSGLVGSRMHPSCVMIEIPCQRPVAIVVPVQVG